MGLFLDFTCRGGSIIGGPPRRQIALPICSISTGQQQQQRQPDRRPSRRFLPFNSHIHTHTYACTLTHTHSVPERELRRRHGVTLARGYFSFASAAHPCRVTGQARERQRGGGTKFFPQSWANYTKVQCISPVLGFAFEHARTHTHTKRYNGKTRCDDDVGPEKFHFHVTVFAARKRVRTHRHREREKCLLC